ncbi:MAG TPA: cellulase family glycosylhydrolase, partial [Acidimicrobiales bacterium]|nr:cellulase family glycosylhydrolase [Acidimicrobiales bacterium]
MRARTALVVVAALAMVAGGIAVAWWTTADDTASSRLSVEGADLVDASGERFVMLGSTLYALPFYLSGDWTDGGLSEETRRISANLEPILDRMVDEGLNTVRIPLGTEAWESDAYAITPDEWLDRVERITVAAAERDMYVMVAWWDAAQWGQSWPERHEESFPMMRAVHERVGGYDNLVVEPMNEPNRVSWEEWRTATSSTMRFWREDLGYDGPLVINTPGWSWTFDPNEADRITALDAEILGEPNVAFANHRYANDNDCFCGDERDTWVDEVGRYITDYPMLVTEIGNFNGDWEPEPRWVDQFASHLVRDRLPDGLDGILVFTWRWSDPITMT